ncbi:NPCBM/NEW2 domain-containing protein [Jiulongibacter sediminis]|uniref:NPCBM/NEW2 domain-containing protein n=1 Tax=Jiulongibacter sediminis TaxID=1605367 RepID=UPI0026EF0415|nr:NPCBM/NEW2 domain-containing protein [Jiulongibacter sediminis]
MKTRKLLLLGFFNFLFLVPFARAQTEECFELSNSYNPIPPGRVNICDLSEYYGEYDRSAFTAIWGHGSPIWLGEQPINNGVPQFSAYKAGWDASSHGAAYSSSVIPYSNVHMFRNVEYFIRKAITNHETFKTKYPNPDYWAAIDNVDAEEIGSWVDRGVWDVTCPTPYAYPDSNGTNIYRPAKFYTFDQELPYNFSNLFDFIGSVAKGMKGSSDFRVTLYGNMTNAVRFYLGDPGKFAIDSNNPYTQDSVDAWTINNSLFINGRIKESEAYVDGNKIYFKVPYPTWQSLYKKSGNNYILDANGNRVWRDDTFHESVNGQTVYWYHTLQYAPNDTNGMSYNMPESRLAVEGIYRVHAMNQMFLMASNHATTGSTSIINQVDRINKLSSIMSLYSENYTYGGNSKVKRDLTGNQIEWMVKSALFKGFDQIETWEDGNLGNGITSNTNPDLTYVGRLKDVGQPIYKNPNWPDTDFWNSEVDDENWNRYKVATKAVTDMRKVFEVHPKTNPSLRYLQFAKHVDAHYNREILIDGLYSGNTVTLMLWYPFNDPTDSQNIDFYMGNTKTSFTLNGRELKTVRFHNIPSGLSASDFKVVYTNISGQEMRLTGDILNHTFTNIPSNTVLYDCNQVAVPTNLDHVVLINEIRLTGDCSDGANFQWEGEKSYGASSNLSANSFASFDLNAVVPDNCRTYKARCVTEDGNASNWVSYKVCPPDDPYPSGELDITTQHSNLLISASQWNGTLKLNTNHSGGPLKIGGETFSTGLGTHSVSNIKYNLGGQYSSFSGKVGLDDAINGQCGDNKIIFRIFGDNNLIWESDPLGKDDLAVSFDESVSGVQELELEVGMGDGSTACDHADWVDLILSGLPTLSRPTDLVASPNPIVVLNGSSTLSANCVVGILEWDGLSGTSPTVSPTQSTVYRARCTEGGNSTDWVEIDVIVDNTNECEVDLLTIHNSILISASQWNGTLKLNTNHSGYPLKIGGVTYSTGLGTHSVSNVKYNLGGTYSSFSGKVGLDDAINGQCGDNKVVFKIYGDNSLIWESSLLGKDDAAFGFDLSVSGVQELELEVDMGDGSTSCDHADWVDLVLGCQPVTIGTPVNVYADPNPIVNSNGFTQLFATCPSGIPEWEGLSGTSPTVSPLTDQIYRVRCKLGNDYSSYVPMTVRVDISGGCQTNLTSLSPLVASQYSGTLKTNLDYSGYGLNIDGTDYSTGLGTHSVSYIKYDVSAGYGAFTGKAGIDDNIIGQCGQNEVEFEIWTDGVKQWGSGILTPTSPAAPFVVQLAGVSELELKVNAGTDGSSCDHANWVNLFMDGCPSQNTRRGTKSSYSPSSQVEIISNVNLSIYPSPAVDKISFGLDKNIEILNASIMDVNGRVLINRVSSENGEVNISSLNPGKYILRVELEEGSLSKGFVKK